MADKERLVLVTKISMALVMKICFESNWKEGGPKRITKPVNWGNDFVCVCRKAYCCLLAFWQTALQLQVYLLLLCLRYIHQAKQDFVYWGHSYSEAFRV